MHAVGPIPNVVALQSVKGNFSFFLSSFSFIFAFMTQISSHFSGFIYHLPRTEQNKIVAIPRAVAKSKVITGGDCSMLAQCFVPVGVGAVAHTTSTNGHIISERYRDHHQLDFQTFHREWSQVKN